MKNFVGYLPSGFDLFETIACIAIVSNRVVARKLARERKKNLKWEESYTNFDNFLGELGGKACSAG